MPGITITVSDENRRPVIDLRDIFRVFDADARHSHWGVKNLEAVGPSADELHNISDQGDAVEGDKLLALLAGVVQTIDGTLEGYRPNGRSPWMLVRAVDGTAFDVESTDETILKKLKAAFDRAADLPS